MKSQILGIPSCLNPLLAANAKENEAQELKDRLIAASHDLDNEKKVCGRSKDIIKSGRIWAYKIPFTFFN